MGLLTQAPGLLQASTACLEDLLLLQLVLFPYPLDHIGSSRGYGKATGKAGTPIQQWAPDCLLYFFLANCTLFWHSFLSLGVFCFSPLESFPIVPQKRPKCTKNTILLSLKAFPVFQEPLTCPGFAFTPLPCNS